jgi:hypothetical protein
VIIVAGDPRPLAQLGADRRIAERRPIVVAAVLNHDFQDRYQEPFEDFTRLLKCTAIQFAATSGCTVDQLTAQDVNSFDRQRCQTQPATLHEQRKCFMIPASQVPRLPGILPEPRIDELVFEQLENQMAQLFNPPGDSSRRI